METKQDTLQLAHAWVETHFRDKVPDQYVYHNFQHTLDVVETAREISGFYDLTEHELELLLLAAYFHDSGYDGGAEGHEDRGKANARQFMSDHQYPEADIVMVEGVIEATKRGTQTTNLLQKILRDADVGHIGSNQYWDRCSRVRQELLLTQQDFMSEEEWADFELSFIQNHRFQTDAAFTLFNDKKQSNIKRLKKYSKRLQRSDEQEEGGKPKKKKKKKNIELKQINLGRGVETMYRTTYRTHLNLSAIADNKANIMLTINALIPSFLITELLPLFDDQRRELIIPLAMLIVVCLTALVFAILSTRPKITEGTFTREDIRMKRANLLFFGNFYGMDINDFHWGMMEMIKDSDFLYSSMTRDLYYLGVVLAKKYKYLRICYNVFMYGLILSVIVFFAIFVAFP